MNGVTILQTIPQYTTTWGWNWALLIPIVLFVVCAFLLVFSVNDNKPDAIAPAIVGLLFAVLLGVAFASSNREFSYNQYQVLIDESVSMTEFTAKYNVIEQQGITYIVEEKVTE